LGDLVKSDKGLCGFLYWDDYLNRYIIKTKEGGNIYSRTFTKIKILHKNLIDNTSVECRRQPNKKRW
jgi:hypothetical protein